MLAQILCAFLQLRRIVVLDVPLLFEKGLDKWCGVSVVVYW
jgi:dephospho-CoA kinase